MGTFVLAADVDRIGPGIFLKQTTGQDGSPPPYWAFGKRWSADENCEQLFVKFTKDYVQFLDWVNVGNEKIPVGYSFKENNGHLFVRKYNNRVHPARQDVYMEFIFFGRDTIKLLATHNIDNKTDKIISKKQNDLVFYRCEKPLFWWRRYKE